MAILCCKTDADRIPTESATMPTEKSNKEITYIIERSGLPESKDTHNAKIRPTLEMGSRGVLMKYAEIPTETRKKIN